MIAIDGRPGDEAEDPEAYGSPIFWELQWHSRFVARDLQSIAHDGVQQEPLLAVQAAQVGYLSLISIPSISNY